VTGVRRGRAASALRGVVAAVALAAVAAATHGCGGTEEGEEVARVNGAVLTVEEFYASVPEQLLAVMSVEDQEEALRTWVKTELFYQEAVRRGIDDDGSIRRRLRELEREIVAEELIRRSMAEVPEVTEAEARIYFDAHDSDYAIQIRLAHILVRSRAEADRALARIREGTPFENVAATVSIDQTAAMGGDLGYMRRGEMVHELEEAAFALKVGEVSDVIPSNYGYHIIKVLDRHPGAGQPSFDSKRAAVLNFLTSQRRRQAFDEWLVELEERATVVIDTAQLRLAAQRRIQPTTGEDYPEGNEAAAESTGVEAP
jgi:peptidyl-prolyl cis-trans isomerase C